MPETKVSPKKIEKQQYKIEKQQTTTNNKPTQRQGGIERTINTPQASLAYRNKKI